jgi:hypothetical protein
MVGAQVFLQVCSCLLHLVSFDQLPSQVDTGSTDLVVYSAGCDGCPNSTNLYDCSKSSVIASYPGSRTCVSLVFLPMRSSARLTVLAFFLFPTSFLLVSCP